MYNFGRGHYEERFREIIFNLYQWLNFDVVLLLVYVLLCVTLVHSSFAIILIGKRELVALLLLSFLCLLIFVWLFLTIPRVCLQFVIVVFPDHTHILVVIQGKMSFKDFFLFLAICLCNFGKRYYGPPKCEILNLGQWLGRCYLKLFLSFALVAVLFAELNHLCN